MEERRRLAGEAALGVARALGVVVERPVILQDSNNTIVGLAPCAVEVEDERGLLRPEGSPALAPADRRFLCGVVDDLQPALSTRVMPTRPLHGSPHEGNWLPAAEGPVLLDFETACTGPLE